MQLTSWWCFCQLCQQTQRSGKKSLAFVQYRIYGMQQKTNVSLTPGFVRFTHFCSISQKRAARSMVRSNAMDENEYDSFGEQVQSSFKSSVKL